MARCNFCGGTFTNAQGVRAHLKSCPAYRQTRPTPPAPRHNQLREDERLLDRLWASAKASTASPRASESDVSEPKSVPHPAGRPPATPTGEDLRQQQAREEARRQAETARQERATRIRAIVQEVKFLVVDLYCPWPPVPPAALAEAKVAIERHLPTHPLLELPRMEVQQIGGAIRDKVYSPYQTPAGAVPAPSSSLITPTPSPLPTQEVIMSKRKIVSGFFECPMCDQQYELERVPEREAVCDECHEKLQEVNEGDDDAD
jgi:hypothetical protein